MNKISEVNKSFLFFLVFTIITSALAYHLITKAYENVFAFSVLETIQ